MVERLIVVAGPICTGKSRILRRLLDGRLADVAARLGIEDADAWSLVSTRRTRARDVPDGPLILHYTLSHASLEEIELRKLVREARRVTVATMVTPWGIYRRRLRWRNRHHIVRRLRGDGDLVRRLREQRDPLVHDIEAVRTLYRRWFEECARRPVEASWVVKSTRFGQVEPRRAEPGEEMALVDDALGKAACYARDPHGGSPPGSRRSFARR